jgi:hypothetical protein
VAALGAATAGVSEEEGGRWAGILEAQHRSAEMADLERRIVALVQREPPPMKVIEHWGAKLEQQYRPGRGATPERMLVKCRTRQLAGSSQSQIRQRACVSTGVAVRLRMVPSCPICDRYTLFVAPDGLTNRPYSVGVLPLLF